MTKKEQMLVDYMFTQAQNLLDFVRMNGLEGCGRVLTTSVVVDKDGDQYSSITADATNLVGGETKTARKSYDCLNGVRTYDYMWEEKNGRQA